MKTRGLALALLLASSPQTNAVAARDFATGIAGTNAPEPRDRAATYFKIPAVRKLLALLEAGPLPKNLVDASLNGSAATADDLVRTHILRANGDRYGIGFSYFTLADEQRIHAVVGRLAPSLVAAYQARRPAFERIFARYDAPKVDRKQLAFVLIAGFGLNWDGLKLTEQLGLRRPEFVTGPGWRYTFWAAETDPTYSDHGFIWGSTTLFSARTNFAERPVDFTFSSFGDPYSDPRMNLPDVFYTPPSDMAADVAHAVRSVGLRSESFAGVPLSGVLGVSRARDLGPMLFALRSHPCSERELAELVAPEDADRVPTLLNLMVVIGYARQRTDHLYELTVPVLASQDRALLDEVLALNKRILASWLRANEKEFRRSLTDLTAARSGVPFETLFTQIWHDLFGVVSRDLVADGMLADPYAPSIEHKGSFGVVWSLPLYHFDPG